MNSVKVKPRRFKSNRVKPKPMKREVHGKKLFNSQPFTSQHSHFCFASFFIISHFSILTWNILLRFFASWTVKRSLFIILRDSGTKFDNPSVYCLMNNNNQIIRNSRKYDEIISFMNLWKSENHIFVLFPMRELFISDSTKYNTFAVCSS